MQSNRESRSSRASRTLPGILLLLTLLAAGGAGAVVVQPAPDFCIAQIQPIPNGVTDRPGDTFNSSPDYNYVHSSTQLQGYPTTEKFAAGLFYFPPAPAELSGFHSTVAVTNPSPTATATIAIEYYGEGGGAPVATHFFTLGPERTIHDPASALVAATPAGRGSARILSTNGVPIVGATVHNTVQMDLSGFGGPFITDPTPFQPGATSMQQLQAAQAAKTSLYFGPLPTSNMSTIDFLNGNNPLFWVVNPNPTPTTISILIVSRGGIILSPGSFTLPAFGSRLDLTLWSALWPVYLAPPFPFDDDFLVVVNGSQPIVGDMVMTDFFMNGAPSNLVLGERFRMGSAMMANTPSAYLVNPELTYQPVQLGIQTLMGLLNPTTTNVGPVTVQYFDRNGVSLGADNFASFPRAAMRRIGPGLPDSPNYPAAATFSGWVRVTACKPGLVGWTMRTGGDVPGATEPVFKEVWGEELSGANGAEPGNGFSVVVAGQTWNRKVSPLVRVDPTWFWPGYTTFLEDGTGNAGAYWYRFYDSAGTNITRIPPPQPYLGVRHGSTSFTYEDALINPFIVFGATTGSGRVDSTNGGIRGINVIGDPIIEWGIFDEFDE